MTSTREGFTVPNSITPPSFSLPKYEHIDSSTLNIIDIITFSTQTVYTGEIIAVIFFAPLMRLNLPKIIFVIFRVLSFTVGDIFVLKIIVQYTLGRLLSES